MKMHERLKVSLVAIASVALLAAAIPAMAGVPDITKSFFVPQAGSTTAPVEGTNATRFFRMCPNNDGGASLFSNSRLKVTVLDINGNGIPGVAAADICVLFNGGTTAQGFSGIGADSVISNSAYNFTPLCPDLRCVTADAATNANGETYITFAGADPLVPGVTLRNPNRKWGHYDTELPVYALGFKLSGKLTSGAAIGTYVLRIKNLDVTAGLVGGVHNIDSDNLGEIVDPADFNGIANNIGSSNVLSYWRDFDSDGEVGPGDFNIITAHVTHNCDTPTP
jgi:hypothetical protein